MKKMLPVLFIVMLLGAILTGCSGKAEKADDKPVVSSTMPTVLNTAEYTLYQNIFYNDTAKDYDGKEAKKEGTFAVLYDAYNKVTRYYVWGYNDQTKCCDWQWEIKPDNDAGLPVAGSLVEVSGIYESNEAALDKFWIIHPTITVKTAFQDRGYDIDMLSMSNTLERVQAANISAKKEAFEGKTVGLYGRVKSATSLEDAYYDNSWEIGISGDFEVPAFGTIVIAEGKVSEGKIIECTLSENTQY